MITKTETIQALKTARENGDRPSAPGADLLGADLLGANLLGANLLGANLRYANLRYANLRYASLRGADLRYADLWYADLRYTDLRGADLRGADLRGANLLGADLLGADLQDANLQDANLQDANLQDANRHILQHRGLRSGEAIFFPTPDGWHLYLGCWGGTLEELRDMIATNEDWPEARGAECDRRRPGLELLIRMCELHMAEHEGVIEALDEKWNKTEEGETR